MQSTLRSPNHAVAIAALAKIVRNIQHAQSAFVVVRAYIHVIHSFVFSPLTRLAAGLGAGVRVPATIASVSTDGDGTTAVRSRRRRHSDDAIVVH